MKQLTVRGFDKELTKRVREMARRFDISLNRAALRLMRMGAGLEDGDRPPRVIGESLDRFFGTWSKEEVKQMEEATKDFERIDPELWK